MLESILTRQNPLDQQVIKAAQGLEFLVLDELHTYRGRQGADVAMLLRRVRQRLSPDNALVASVCSKLFGTTIPPTHVVTETLERVTEGDLPSGEELRQALAEAVSPGDVESLRRTPSPAGWSCGWACAGKTTSPMANGRAPSQGRSARRPKSSPG